jgi:hypothetical protein
MHVLVIDYRPDYSTPEVFGPFTTVKEAQNLAERYRKLQGLPVKATPENNEEWSDLGWYFGIIDLQADTAKLEAAMKAHPEVWQTA